VPKSLKNLVHSYSDKAWQIVNVQNKAQVVTGIARLQVRNLMEAVVTRYSAEAAAQDAEPAPTPVQPKFPRPVSATDPVTTVITEPYDDRVKQAMQIADQELRYAARRGGIKDVKMISVAQDANGGDGLHFTYTWNLGLPEDTAPSVTLRMGKDAVSGVPKLVGATVYGLVDLSDQRTDHFMSYRFPVFRGMKEIQEETTIADPHSIQAARLSSLDKGMSAPEAPYSSKLKVRGYRGGLNEPAIMGEENATRCHDPGPMHPGTWELKLGLLIDGGWRSLLPGRLGATTLHATVRIDQRAEPTLAPNPDWVFTNEAQPPIEGKTGWVAMDGHQHSGDRSGDANSHIALNILEAIRRKLDAMLFSDHNNIGIAGLKPDPRIILPRAEELTTPSGHFIILGAKERIVPWDGDRTKTFDELRQEAEAQGAVFIIAHAEELLGKTNGPKIRGLAGTMGLQMIVGRPGSNKKIGFEIHNGNRRGGGGVYDRLSRKLLMELQDLGYHVVLSAGSDDHSGGATSGFWGTHLSQPVVLAHVDEGSEAGIIDAFKNGRTQVSRSGPDDVRSELTYSVPRVGDTLYAHKAEVGITVDHAMGQYVRLVSNTGNVVAEGKIDKDEGYTFKHTVTAPSDGEAWYMWEIFNRSEMPTALGKVINPIAGRFVEQVRNVHSAFYLRKP
jgi:hypothetical protein